MFPNLSVKKSINIFQILTQILAKFSTDNQKIFNTKIKFTFWRQASVQWAVAELLNNISRDVYMI